MYHSLRSTGLPIFASSTLLLEFIARACTLSTYGPRSTLRAGIVAPADPDSRRAAALDRAFAARPRGSPGDIQASVFKSSRSASRMRATMTAAACFAGGRELLRHVDLADRKAQRLVLGARARGASVPAAPRAPVSTGVMRKSSVDERRGQIGRVGVEQLPAQIGLPVGERGVRDLAIQRFEEFAACATLSELDLADALQLASASVATPGAAQSRAPPRESSDDRSRADRAARRPASRPARQPRLESHDRPSIRRRQPARSRRAAPTCARCAAT